MRIKFFVFTFVILLALLLQTTVLNYIRIYNVKPNLLLIIIICTALLRGNKEGAVVGLFAGLAWDLNNGMVLGFYALLGLYLGLSVGSLNKRLYRENFIVVIFFTLISSIVFETGVYVLSSFLEGGMDIVFVLKNVIVPEAIFNCLISIFIFVLIMKIYDKIDSMDKYSRKF